MNGKGIIAAIALIAISTGTALADPPYGVKARVTHVEPVYETVIVETPVTRCHRQIVERRVAAPSIAGQTLAGAVIGAAIGRQFGDGNGRDALTVLGAMAGSAVAHERAARGGSRTARVVRQPVEQCTTEYRRHAERQLTGYWVEYRHRGRQYRIWTHERPGRHIRLARRS